MAEWAVCGHCQLKHTLRPDGNCPRCKQPVVAGPVAVPGPSAEAQGDGARSFEPTRRVGDAHAVDAASQWASKPSHNQAVPQLGRGYKIGLGVAGAAYLFLALLATGLEVLRTKATMTSVDLSFLGGMVVGFFGACVAVPVVVALIIAALGSTTRRIETGPRFWKALLWTLLALLPLQGASLLMASVKLAGTRVDVRSAAYLNKGAAEVNKTLPKMIDEETELTRVSALEGVVVYNYRLVNATSTDVNPDAFAAVKAQLIKGACTTPQTHDKFLKQDITLRYSYVDKDKHPIASFDVTLADCR